MPVPPLHDPAHRRGEIPTRQESLAASLALVGESELMRRLRMQIQVIAPHMRTAFVLSEPGLGEDTVAAELHRSGPGRDGSLLAVSAAELKTRLAQGDGIALTALLERAAGGSIFLREVGDLPPQLQGELLEYLRQHGRDAAGAQVITSSRQTLKTTSHAGVFSAELLYRLTAVVVQIPQLAERSEDLPVLVTLGVDTIAQEYGRPAPSVASDAMEMLLKHGWPGNLLELENVLRQAVLESEHERITGAQVSRLLEDRLPDVATTGRGVLPGTMTRLQDVIDNHVLAVMERCGGNKLRAAETLGVSRSTLYRMLDAAASSSEKSA